MAGITDASADPSSREQTSTPHSDPSTRRRHRTDCEVIVCCGWMSTRRGDKDGLERSHVMTGTADAPADEGGPRDELERETRLPTSDFRLPTQSDFRLR